YAYTGGQDCIVRIWKMGESVEQEPLTASEAESSITTVAAYDNGWLSGSEDAVVRQYLKHKPELTGHVWDANGVAIRSIAVDSEGRRVAIASENFDVKVVDLEDIKIVKTLKGHVGGVRNVTWHPNSLRLTTSGADGKIIVWNLSKDEPEVETTIDGLIPVTMLTTAQLYGIRPVNTFTRHLVLMDPSPHSPSLSTANISQLRLVLSQSATPGATITHLAFSPKENLLAWTDTEGGFNRWHQVIPETHPSPVQRSVGSDTSSALAGRPKSTLFDDIAEAGNKNSRQEFDDVGNGFGDADDDWIIDDLGGGLQDNPESTRKGDGLVKEMAQDLLDEELTTDDILKREHAMDKEFIMLIQAACKADNVPRAIELAKLLHNNGSFDSAMKIADFYHLVGLREKIAMLKAEREENEDRRLAARDKRRRWLKPDPPIREVQSSHIYGGSERADPLGDERRPPPVERPRLARVTVPVVESTRFSSVAPSSSFTPAKEGYSSANDLDSPGSTYADAKRKRVETEEVDSSFPTPPPPKQKTTNPFARKPGQEVRNPFARKAEVNGKTIKKSESFFEKVDAAESGKRPFAKPAPKQKGVVRQTTLFGLPASTKPKEQKPKEKKAANTDTIGETGGSLMTDEDVAMLDTEEMGGLIETQMETQETQESQEPDLVETQPADESVGF
ncbi:hypothetical protein H0H93_005614, partial [Arthromyces matolae]